MATRKKNTEAIATPEKYTEVIATQKKNHTMYKISNERLFDDNKPYNWLTQLFPVFPFWFPLKASKNQRFSTLFKVD